MKKRNTMIDKVEAGTQYYVLFSAGSRIPTERELEALVEKTGAVIRVVAPGLLKAYPPSEANKEEWVMFTSSHLEKTDLYKVVGVTKGTGIQSRQMRNENK
jgi:hypothetical protein